MPDVPDLDYIAEPLRHLAVPIAELVPDPANARTHDEANLAAIRGSLRQFGQRMPIVVQEQGMIVRAGNGRLQAAISLGWTHIAAVIVPEDNVSAIAFAISDNRTAELAGWDDAVLDQLLREIEVGDADLQQMLEDLAEDQGLIPEDDETDWPEVSAPTEHTCTICYTDDDLPSIRAFLGVDKLPEIKLGAMILERIKESPSSEASL